MLRLKRKSGVGGKESSSLVQIYSGKARGSDERSIMQGANYQPPFLDVENGNRFGKP